MGCCLEAEPPLFACRCPQRNDGLCHYPALRSAAPKHRQGILEPSRRLAPPPSRLRAPAQMTIPSHARNHHDVMLRRVIMNFEAERQFHFLDDVSTHSLRY